jgi:hypothetical protein
VARQNSYQPADAFTFLADVQVAPQGAWHPYEDAVASLLAPGSATPLLESTPVIPWEWVEVRSTLITDELTRRELRMITEEEGRQQEVLVSWLFDALPAAVRNPEVHEQRRDLPTRGTLTPLMAFDGILIKRFEQAGKQPTPYFRFHVTITPKNRMM